MVALRWEHWGISWDRLTSNKNMSPKKQNVVLSSSTVFLFEPFYFSLSLCLEPWPVSAYLQNTILKVTIFPGVWGLCLWKPGFNNSMEKKDLPFPSINETILRMNSDLVTCSFLDPNIVVSKTGCCNELRLGHLWLKKRIF